MYGICNRVVFKDFRLVVVFGYEDWYGARTLKKWEATNIDFGDFVLFFLKGLQRPSQQRLTPNL